MRGELKMKEEDDILRKIGKENPFKVPDGYFDNFTSGLMEILPEKPDMPKKKPITTWTKIQPWVYMAAMFIGAALFIRVVSFTENEKARKAKSTAETELTQEKYVQNVVESSRMDDYQLYEFLTDANQTSENRE